MFGQPPAASPFGTPGTTAGGTSLFGAPSTTPAFGSPTPAPTGFGATSATATNTPATSGFSFGSPAPAPSNTGFGVGVGAFGAATPAPAPSGFGAFGATPAPAPAFGAAAPSTPFGAPAPAPSGGLFGAPAPAPSGGLFGGGGTTAATGGFGSTMTTTSAFGAQPSTSAFGSTGTTSAFGAAAPATSTFGAPVAAPAGGLFGAPAPATSAFGAAAPATSAFGAPVAAPAGGLFGSPVPAAGGGMFGGGAAVGAGKPGTLQMPYADTRIADGSTQINFKSISAMTNSPYDKKSFEELRIEDYMSGNKGSQGQPVQQATGAFGAPAAAPAGGLFGARTPAPSAFGAAPAPAGGLFGSPAAAPAFGAAPAAPSGGLFGAPAPAPAAGGFSFGATSAPAPSGGLFGATPAAAPAGGGLFGSTPAAAPATGGFSFGATPAPAPSGGLFGSTTPVAAPAGGLFGAPAPAPATGGFSFGGTPAAPAAGGFGASPAAAPAGGLFGAPAPASGGLFGAPAPAPSGGLFGATTAAPVGGSLFGAPAPAPSGGLFGAPAPATGGLFGAPAPAAGGGLFGAPAPVGGAFGAPAQAPAFGAMAQPVQTGFGASPGMPVAAATTMLVPPSADTLLAQQLAAVETQKKEMAVLDALRGSSNGSGSSAGKVIPTSIYQSDAAAVRYRGLASGNGSVGGGGSLSQPSTLYAQKIAPRSTAKVRPRGFGPSTPQSGLLISNARNNARSTTMTPSGFIGSSTKHLVIKPGALTLKPKTRLLLSDEPLDKTKTAGALNDDTTRSTSNSTNDTATTGKDLQSPNNTNGVIRGSAIENGTSNTPASQRNTSSSSSASAQKSIPFDVARIANDEAAFTSPEAVNMNHNHNHRDSNGTPKSTIKKKSTLMASSNKAYEYYNKVIHGSSPKASYKNTLPNDEREESKSSGKNLVPKLTKEHYTVTPSMEELGQMSEVELATLSNFVVEKIGVASVAWDGAVDIRGIDLDSIISIEPKDVSVYEEQEKAGTKPPVGTKLNRPAVITFHDIYPKGGADASVEVKSKFEKRIQKNTKAMGAELIQYDGEKGIWMIKVPHFSRYAFMDDSEDEDEQQAAKSKAPVKKDFDSGVGGGPTRSINGKVEQTYKRKVRLSRIRAPLNEDEEMEDYNEEPTIVLGIDSGDKAIQAAEAAYEKMTEMRKNEMSAFDTMHAKEQRSMYVEGFQVECGYNTHVPAPEVNLGTKSAFSVCKELAKQCQINNESSSATDYSMRMGRSFRIGWMPNGSLFSPSILSGTRNDDIIQLRPLIVSSSATSNLLSAHLQNSVNILQDGDIPIFALPAVSKNTYNPDDTIFRILDEYERICKKSSEEHKDDLVNDIISQSFSLIQILFGNASFNDPRQKSRALSTWLRDLCAKNVERDISLAKQTNSFCVAIFAALSGGDINKASSLALENGLIHLSVIIANATLQAGADISIQMQSWEECGSSRHMPLHLERIYKLLSRDLALENDLYKRSGPSFQQSLDWKRRLAILEGCIGGSIEDSEESPIASLLNNYDADVNAGKAPPANTWYNNSRIPEPLQEERQEKCILYRLMKVFTNTEANNNDDSLAHLISPNGHTNDPHDVSFSFHLAAILSALKVSCKPISRSEECRLLEGYALSLTNNGCWELAIYVILCTFREGNITSQDIEWKKKMAVDILCKHYPNDEDSRQRRHFLETKVGIPSDWFDLALSYQPESLHQQTFKTRIMDNSISQAVATFEATVLPSILFDGDKEKCSALATYIEEIYNGLQDPSSLNLGRVVLEYLRLSQIMLEFSLNGGLEGHELNFDDMIARAEDIQSTIPKLQQISDSSRSFSSPPVPRHVTIAELESAVILLIIQLNVLKRGGSILETNKMYERYKLKALKIMSKLEYVLSRGDEKVSFPSNHQAGSSIVRGKCGVEIKI